MSDRHDATGVFVWTFGDEFLVACPRCAGKASVLPQSRADVRLTCASCGLARTWIETSKAIQYGQDAHLFKAGEVSVGAAVDWYFHLKLWLQTPCCGAILWAYNGDHLRWLRAFVSARLRERAHSEGHGWSNQALASRLPKWMTTAKHRAAVLAAIAKIERTLL